MGPALACARRLFHGAAIAALTSKGHCICTVSGVEGCVAGYGDSGRLKTSAETERAQPNNAAPSKKLAGNAVGLVEKGFGREMWEGAARCTLLVRQ